jgi:hypothetical protein
MRGPFRRQAEACLLADGAAIELKTKVVRIRQHVVECDRTPHTAHP